MAPMQRERCRFSLNVVLGRLYAIGGASEMEEEAADEEVRLAALNYSHLANLNYSKLLFLNKGFVTMILYCNLICVLVYSG